MKIYLGGVMYESNNKMLKEAKDGSSVALGRIIELNSGLIWSIVKRFTGRGYDLEDLYQIGCIGMIKCVRKFDFNYNVKFSTYAVPYILGEIKKFLRDDGIIKVSRNTKELAMKIKEVEKNWISKSGNAITIKELSESLNVSEEEVCIAIDSLKKVKSINEDLYEDGSMQQIERIESDIDEQGRIIDKIAIKSMIEKLNKRDKKIIVLRFYKEKTQMQVAKILGISQVQVSRIEKRILKDFRKKLISECG
jgi:RNA polymerase sporulation-specific sigma factor